MVNNGGDIGKTLEQLGSEQSVKNMLIAMGIGATDAYTSDWGTTRVQSSGNTVVTDWTQRAQGYGVNTLVKGTLTGANNAQEWATIAGAGAAGCQQVQYLTPNAPDGAVQNNSNLIQYRGGVLQGQAPATAP